MRLRLTFLAYGLFIALPLFAATGTHLDGSTLYPRLIRLHHAPKPLRNTLLAKTGNRLFRSSDDGRTFTSLATVPTASLEQGSPTPDRNAKDNAKDKERCCSTIYELPRKVGQLRAGTLLYSGSFFSAGVPAIKIYISTDQGAHWQYFGTPLRAGDDHHGLWEPEFTIARDHSLVMLFSDETQTCCSQTLAEMHTADGLRWSPKQNIVAGTAQPDRPGMAIVSQPTKKLWLLSYEVCGPTTHCQVYIRTSTDGLRFGDPRSFGTKVISTTGQILAHTPANLYDPHTRKLLLVGQVLYEADGSVSPQNGKLLFTTSSQQGVGLWQTIPAPVQVPSAYDNYCPNYSSALMPTSAGLLELASDYDAGHHCTSYFASLPAHL